MSEDIRAAIERSSLGTKKAAQARRTVSASAASKVVARSSSQPVTGRNSPKKSGG